MQLNMHCFLLDCPPPVTPCFYLFPSLSLAASWTKNGWFMKLRRGVIYTIPSHLNRPKKKPKTWIRWQLVLEGSGKKIITSNLLIYSEETSTHHNINMWFLFTKYERRTNASTPSSTRVSGLMSSTQTEQKCILCVDRERLMLHDATQ